MCFLDLVIQENFIQWKTDHTRMDSDGLQNTLPDPPYGEGNEFESTRYVESTNRFYKPNISFIDKIRKRKSLPLVLFGDRNYKPQVAFNETIMGSFVPPLNTPY